MPKCLTCGNHVTERFARVFGNNENVVRRCIGCSRAADLDECPEPNERERRVENKPLTTWS